MHTTHLTWSFFTGNSALKALCDAYVPSAVTSFCTIPCVIWMSSSFSSPAAFFISSSTIGIWSAQPSCQRCHVNTLNKKMKLEAKDVLPNKSHARCRNHPHQRCNGLVRYCITLFAASAWQCIMQQNGSFVCCQAWWECTARSLSVVTLTFDLDMQTSPSEGQNMSSLWTWCKSIPEIFGSQTKKITDSTKNRTLCSLQRAVITIQCQSTEGNNSTSGYGAVREIHKGRGDIIVKVYVSFTLCM